MNRIDSAPPFCHRCLQGHELYAGRQLFFGCAQFFFERRARFLLIKGRDAENDRILFAILRDKDRFTPSHTFTLHPST